ncbi:MAG: hypothetical protein MHM6MM_003060 [Cercozoa sp. M6MM]
MFPDGGITELLKSHGWHLVFFFVALFLLFSKLRTSKRTTKATRSDDTEQRQAAVDRLAAKLASARRSESPTPKLRQRRVVEQPKPKPEPKKRPKRTKKRQDKISASTLWSLGEDPSEGYRPTRRSNPNSDDVRRMPNVRDRYSHMNRGGG